MKRENNRGFTLIELLVSISIIAILVAIASVSFSAAQKKARDARRMEDVRTIAKGAETYYFLAGYVYPSNTNPWTVPAGVVGAGDTIIALFPSDPKKIGWTGYVYSNPGGSTSSYCACARVEASANGNSTSNACAFTSAGGDWFCMRNQQ